MRGVKGGHAGGRVGVGGGVPRGLPREVPGQSPNMIRASRLAIRPSHVCDELAAHLTGCVRARHPRRDVAFVAGRQPGREHLGRRPQDRAVSADSLPFTGSAGGDRLDGARRADIGTWRSCCSTGVPLWCSSCCPAGRRGAEAQRRRGATISSARCAYAPVVSICPRAALHGAWCRHLCVTLTSGRCSSSIRYRVPVVLRHRDGVRRL